MRNDEFGRLLKAGLSSIALCEGKNQPAIEDDLGQQIGVTAASIQRYKAGHIPPELRTLEILADAAVKRGFLNRDWVGRFLRTAGYPAPERLLDRLFPTAPARPRAPRVYANLPAPTYSQFVMRAQAFAEVLEGLAARSAAVLIVGLGGQGKTSLAREVADACLKGVEGAPSFDAAVWVSDKDRPGTTNLSTVLDEIARTLDYPGFTQFEHDEKRREVEQLLRKQKVLLVVDNFETVTDGALLSWLLRLPEPSKALITSREKQRGLWSSWLAELRGMTEAEAQALITQRLRMLQLDKKVKDPAEFEPLVAVTGGNPKAIEIALGVVKHERRPLQQVVDDLYAARGELFDDLFARAWSLLDEAARRVLMVMTFFPDSASGEAVAASADVQGYAFDRAVERLTDLALLDIQQADLSSAPRYTLHPLVRVFAEAGLKKNQTFSQEARSRWVNWYIAFVQKIGYCWDNIELLEQLDNEWKTTYQVIEWLKSQLGHVEIVQIAKGLSYFLYIRGLWQKNIELCLLAAESSKCIPNNNAEVEYLCYAVQLLTKQEKTQEASNYLSTIDKLVIANKLEPVVFLEYQHTHIVYLEYLRNYEKADTIRFQIIGLAEKISPPKYIAIRTHLALNRFAKGLISSDEVKRDDLELLAYAKEKRVRRAESFFYAHLSRITLEQGDINSAAQYLEESNNIAAQIQDTLSIAYNHISFSRIHALRGDKSAARTTLLEAIDLFERLGLRNRLSEARSQLAKLDSGIATAPNSPL